MSALSSIESGVRSMMDATYKETAYPVMGMGILLTVEAFYRAATNYCGRGLSDTSVDDVVGRGWFEHDVIGKHSTVRIRVVRDGAI